MREDGGRVESSAIDAEWLDSARRSIITTLRKLDSQNSREGFSAWITRLQNENKIPANIAICVKAVSNFRNLAVYEQYLLAEREQQLVKLAMEEFRLWAERRSS